MRSGKRSRAFTSVTQAQAIGEGEWAEIVYRPAAVKVADQEFGQMAVRPHAAAGRSHIEPSVFA
jgi:hypothetical protein